MTPRTPDAPPTAGWGRLADVQPDEAPGVAWAFVELVLLLGSLYVVRPLRDEMGIQAGVEDMQWLFTGTFVAMLVVVPTYGWVVARVGRHRLIPIVHLLLALGMVFAFSLWGVADVSWRPWVAAAIFIWISVFNLLVISAFWSSLADLFTLEQGRRLFGLVAAGGSLGALLGPLSATVIVGAVGPMRLLWVSAGLLVLAAVAAWRLERTMGGTGAPRQAVGGGAWNGLRLAWSDPLLRNVIGYLLLMTWISTIFYFEQARIVEDASADPAERTSLFAQMDLGVNALALVLQLLLTGRLIRWLGLPGVLVLLPVLSLGALAVLGLWPVLGVLVAVQVLRRAINYALAKPAREILFTVVAPESKYKGKSVVDTLVYRGGDALAGWGFAGLESLGLGLAAIAWASIPLTALWAALARRLGKMA